MRYATIRNMDISNGEGIACSLFVQGCTHHCKGCFNYETWNFNGGEDFTEEIKNKFIELCKAPYIDCVSFLGGEPLDQPLDEMLLLIKELKKINKPIYVWTGYTFEELTDEQMEIIKNIDILIDGEFQEDKKDLRLQLRGSSNQRIIDVQASIKQNKTITIKKENIYD